MGLKAEDLEDQSKYRQIIAVSYSSLIDFVLDYLRRKSGLMIFFWSACLIFLAIALFVRINLSGYFLLKNIITHSTLGLIVFPLLSIPLHEILHIIPFFLAGARKIRVGMDLKQYIFYVTAHRHVASARQFSIVALVPFVTVTIALFVLILFSPGLWKWSLSLFLFVHTTMCAGDFALLNFLWLNRHRKIYTWDDADEKMAYF
ncbi:MAG: hypothetical protein A2V64_03320, partial [Bacteroidetes bacterium RBG_13_43_22]